MLAIKNVVKLEIIVTIQVNTHVLHVSYVMENIYTLKNYHNFSQWMKLWLSLSHEKAGRRTEGQFTCLEENTFFSANR